MNPTTFPYFKFHALGNDYIVLRQSDTGELSSEQIVRICHRHFGIGSDGILLDTQTDKDAPFSLRIFNPDGGEAEKSGNGLRIFSRFLWEMKRVGKEPFEIETLGGLVRARVLVGGSEVRVAMGVVSFTSDVIPMTGTSREVLRETLTLENGEQVEMSAANIGNPHCIILSDNPTRELAERLGSLIENHKSFPERTNVQFAKVVNRNQIKIEIWERGAGYTLASGSSSSATAAVLRRLDLVDSKVLVEMPGGVLDVTVHDDYQVTMQGDVTQVSYGDFCLEALDFAVEQVPSKKYAQL
ncbi:UNVERIFIED_CONTAM: hypothetical protein GTU68_065076 [Idotea baltica]|nr:hypothetical protein [Idotea baltica]